MKRYLALALIAASAAGAQEATPVGLWKTIDDSSHEARSLVRITEDGGIFTGRIEKTLDPDAKAEDSCERCTDERKNKPLVGLLLIRNVRRSPDDRATFEGGDILDPEDGKVYRVRLKTEDGGKRLQVRGYIGPFYRSQYWFRVE